MRPRRDGRRGCAAGFSEASLGCPRGGPKMASGERRPPEAGCTFGAPSTWISFVRLLPSRARLRFSRRTEITQWMHVPLASFGHPSHASKIQGGLGDWFPRKDKKCCSAGMPTLKPDEPKKRRPQRIVRALASWTRPRPGYPLSGCVPASRRAGTFHRASIRVVLRHRDRNTRTSIPGTHGTPEPCLRKSIQWDAFPTQIPEEPFSMEASLPREWLLIEGEGLRDSQRAVAAQGDLHGDECDVGERGGMMMWTEIPVHLGTDLKTGKKCHLS